MSDITMIGLGLMGSALAEAMLKAGHKLTVWNRSAVKMEPFITGGAAGAPDAAAAIAASPVVVICIDNYAVTNAMLRSAEIAPLVSGRTIVQLSTGTPLEARDSGKWMQQHDALYLDGAILCGPQHIGTAESQILLCGDGRAHEQCAPLLACLGGEVRYLGENVRTASALDLAWLCESFGRFLAVTHAACLCESEQVDFGLYPMLFPEDELVRNYADVIVNNDYEHCTATLSVWGAALQRIQQQGREAGINTDFPDLAAGLFKKAVDAGYGEHNVMSLFKVLRQPGEDS